MNKQSKILVTGIGSITSAGNTAGLWEAITRKKNCLSEFKAEEKYGIPAKVIGRVSDKLNINVPRRIIKQVSRNTLLGNSAFIECCKDAGNLNLDDKKTGLIFGSASMGQDMIMSAYEKVSNTQYANADYNILNTISNAGAAQLLAASNKISGFVQGVEGASCSGILAIINAVNLIKNGVCDRIFCVIGDANIFPGTMLFYSRKIRMNDKSYSFYGELGGAEEREVDKYIMPFANQVISDRGAIAEGGAAILLESESSAIARGATVYGEMENLHFCFHADNYHGTDKDRIGIKEVLKNYNSKSFNSAYLPITGCYPLDASTIKICSDRFPEIHAFSAEAVIGHTGATSSFINIILALLSIKEKCLLPTKNFEKETMDIHCKLKPENTLITNTVVNNIVVVSTGFGGYNGACNIKNYR